MKYLFITAIILCNSFLSAGQTMQASIGVGSTSSRVIVYIKPTSAVSGTISTLQFDIAIDNAVTPVPVVTVISTPVIAVTWNIDPSYVEGAYRHYQFTTAASPTVSIGAAVETEVMELEFSGGPVAPNNVSLVTLPGGGTSTGNALYYCSGAATAVEGQLYYSRAGTTVVNNMSYTGALVSYATLAGIILPVNWLTFDIVRQGNNGLLNWTVANQESSQYYEVQRSINGTNFTAIALLNKSGNTAYQYTDAGINMLGAPILYYRIKQVDIDGKMVYSPVRMLRLDLQGIPISIFPNPVREGFYISIPSSSPNDQPVTLKLFAANGQMICSKEITTAQAINYYFDIKGRMLAAGQYNLQIIFDNQHMETKKLLIIQ